MPTDVPLSVWPTAQATSRTQRAGRYLPLSGTHPARMLPAIAARAIEAYTSPGDLVVDPMCGVGTTLVEAMHLGRDAIGVEYEDRWATLAEANLAHARSQGASGHGEVVVGDARHLPGAVDPAVRGLVALVLTSPPYGPSLHGQVRARPGKGIEKSNFRYSKDPANLAHVGNDALLEAMRQIFLGCAALLRPGGIVAMTVRPWWHDGELIDLPGALVRVGESAGLVLFERNVMLLAAIRDDGLIPRVVLRARTGASGTGRRRASAGCRPRGSVGLSRRPNLRGISRTERVWADRRQNPVGSLGERRRSVCLEDSPLRWRSGLEALTSLPELWPPPVDRNYPGPAGHDRRPSPPPRRGLSQCRPVGEREDAERKCELEPGRSPVPARLGGRVRVVLLAGRAGCRDRTPAQFGETFRRSIVVRGRRPGCSPRPGHHRAELADTSRGSTPRPRGSAEASRFVVVVRAVAISW